MKWIQACLRNKLLVILSVLLFCALGFFALMTRPLTPFPHIIGEDINISIVYPGASAQTVQQQVTSPVVQQLQGLNNLRYTQAYSQAGQSNIDIQLNSGAPLDLIQTQLQIIQAINSAHLPAVVPQPQIQVDTGQAGLISFMAFSDKMTQFEMDNFLAANLMPKLNSIPGATAMNNFLDPVVRIKIKPEELAKYKISLNDAINIITANYQQVPLGSIYVDQKDYVLSFNDKIQSLPQFENILLAYRTADGKVILNQQGTAQIGVPIYLKDIATVGFEPREITQQPYSSYNGHLGARIWVSTFAVADPFMVTKQAMQALNELKRHLPEDMKIIPDFDMSKVMAASIKEVSFTIGLASILVLLVALIFLGHLRTTIIPIVTIPICLLGAVIVMTLFGFNISIVSLLAMVIAVGLVVDDAIVVVENITRHLENGASKTDAVLNGSSDIMKVIIGITLTLLAVYLPIIFASGQITALLKPFAITLAGAVFISGIVSLTLTPVMAAKLVVSHEPNRYQKWFDNVLYKIIHFYQSILQGLLRASKLSLLLIIILLAIGAYFAAKLPARVFPNDPNNLVQITVDASTGDDVMSLRKKMQQFKQFYHVPEVQYTRISVSKDSDSGLWQGLALIKYKNQYIRENQSYADAINLYISQHKIPNAHAQMLNFSQWGNYDLEFYIYGSDNTHVENAAQEITQIMQKSNHFVTVGNGMSPPQKQLAFSVDTVKAARLGIYRPDISQLLSTYYGGYTLKNYFSIAGLSVPIIVQLNNVDRTEPTSINKLVIQSPLTQSFYPLADFVTLKTVANPQSITTFNNLPAVRIHANLAKGYSLGEAVGYVTNLLNIHAPNLQYHYINNAEDYLNGNKQTLYIALFGILCVYFLLAVIFKNLLDPFIIMLTVPFTVIGGALSLYLVDGSLNFYSVLGLITLIGLITKHGVLIVQFANTELAKGGDVLHAILMATKYRFRPIMMTTLAMIFGALPLTLSHEVMYASREQLGVVIMGGLAVGTIFSLFIVPIVYVLMKKIENKK